MRASFVTFVLLFITNPVGSSHSYKQTKRAKTKKDDYFGREIEFIPILKDGEKGVYTIELLGHAPFFMAPITDLPNEIAMIPKTKANDWGVRAFGRQQGWLALAANSSATVTFTALPSTPVPVVAYVRVEDSQRKTLLDVNLLDIGKRKKASVELKSGDKMGIWSYYAVADYGPDIA